MWCKLGQFQQPMAVECATPLTSSSHVQGLSSLSEHSQSLDLWPRWSHRLTLLKH